MKINKNFIPKGQVNRPATNRGMSVYGWTMTPRYITIHNAWSFFDAETLNTWMISSGADTVRYPSTGGRLAGWHFSVDEREIWQGLPLNEPAWHAGDYVSRANPGIGNTQSIGIEICDYSILYREGGNLLARRHTHPNYASYLAAENLTAKLVAYLIDTLPSLKPFPECVKQHADWRPASGCPSHIRRRPNGWNEFLGKVEAELNKKEKDKEEKEKVDPNLFYRVIAGSFTQRINAVRIQNRLQQEGYSAFLLPYKNFFRVVAGSYNYRHNAERVVEELKAKNYSAFLLPFRRR